MSDAGADVTAVLPTTGRASLARAVSSALNQAGLRCDVLIVADVTSSRLAAIRELVADFDEERVSLLSTGGQKGAGEARYLATAAATSPWVAYLDDDDEWAPTKCCRQIDERSPENPVLLSCQTITVSPTGKRVVAPHSTFEGGAVDRYLFYRRRLRADRNLLHTSTLVVPTWLAQRVQWDRGLRRHQDWDFVLRLWRSEASVVQLPEPLVTCAAGSEGSVSGGDSWEESLDWAQHALVRSEPRVMSDFLAGQPLRYALQARSAAGVLRTVGAIARTRRAPSMRAIALGMSGVIPRRQAVALMHRSAPT